MVGELILFFSFLGSTLVIAPTFKRVNRKLIDTQKVDAIQKSRHQLLEFKRVVRTDVGFAHVRGIFRSQSTRVDWDNVAGFYPLVFGAYGGGGGWIYLLSEEEVEMDNPLNDGSAKKFESILITDQWLQNEVVRLQSQPKQRVRATGLALLVLSILLQALTAASIIST